MIDYEYFVGYVVNHLVKNKVPKICLLQDNTSWYRGYHIRTSPFYRYFEFNVKGFPMLNVIENLFSLIKHRFYRRIHMQTDQEEVRFIVELFKLASKDIYMAVFTRNLLRALKKTLLVFHSVDGLRSNLKNSNSTPDDAAIEEVVISSH